MQRDACLALQAWQKYVDIGALDAKMLRPVVLRAWERSHAGRVSPRLPRAERLSASETQQLLTRNSELMAVAEPYLGAISRAAGDGRHGVLLSAANGALLMVRGDPQSLDGPEALPPVGTLLGEGAAGANGIGTPLAEGTYAEILGAEHFIRGFHEHTCLGVPVLGANDEIVGALCLSVRNLALGRQLQQLLLTAARGIQVELRGLSLRARLAELRRDPSDGARVVAGLHQEVVQSHTAARLQIEMGANKLRDGGTSTHLQGAIESIDRYFRSASTWQLASGCAPCSPISCGELVKNVVELMQTDARIQHVSLSAKIGSECERTATPELARQLIAETSRALRTAGATGFTELHLSPDGVLSVEAGTGGEAPLIVYPLNQPTRALS